MRPERAGKAGDWVAVLAVCSERLSAVHFPDLRENTGNLVGISPSEALDTSLCKGLRVEFPGKQNREILAANRERSLSNRTAFASQ